MNDTVKVGPIKYTIIKTHMENIGEHSSWRAKIYIDDEVDEEANAAILWHEVCHAIATQGGWSKSTMVDEDYDLLEKIIRTMGYGILQVLRDNPWMREL